MCMHVCSMLHLEVPYIFNKIKNTYIHAWEVVQEYKVVVVMGGGSRRRSHCVVID